MKFTVPAFFLIILISRYEEVGANNVPDVPEDVAGMNRTLLVHDAFDAVDTMLDRTDDKQVDLQEYIRQLFMFGWRTPIIDASTMHQYDSLEDKLISGGPKVNHTDCNNKLKYLVDRVRQERANGLSLVGVSKDYRLFNLLDSYGRPEGSFVRGVINWMGDYDQCLMARYGYDDDTDTLSGSRYCLAKLRWPKWKLTNGFNEWKYSTVKSAVCLPESCDSIAAEDGENKQMISELMEVNFSPAFKDYQIGDIYCLPDKDSPLTQWRYDFAASCVIMFFTVWLLAVIGATIMDIHGGDELKLSYLNYIEIFSLAVNARKLFDFSKPEGDEISEAKKEIPLEQRQQDKVTNSADIVAKQSVHNAERAPTPTHGCSGKLIDLNFLHCVKVICLFIVMKTHFFLFMTTIVRSSDLMKSWISFDIYHVSLGGMGVNNFFMITGAIISYLIFTRFPAISVAAQQKKDKSNLKSGKCSEKSSCVHPILQPSVWIGFCTSRYLRIMPMWIIVTLVAKYVAKYLGSGPCWDYGTSKETNLSMCKEESWLYTLLAVVNLRPEYQNCIPSAWYLAIDLQCTIVLAPIIIIAYLKAPRLAFMISITLPFVHFFHYLGSDVYIPELVRDLTRYGVNSMASSTIFGHELNRIYHYTPARATYFFMGVTAGYMLHIYETNNRNAFGEDLVKSNKLHFIVRIIGVLRRPWLSHWFTVTFLFIMIFIPVFILPYLPESYLLISYFNIATVHVCFALIVLLYAYLMPTILIQLSTGSLGNSNAARAFFNWTGWLPISRISLTFLLLDPLLVLIYNGRLEHMVLLNPDMHVVVMTAQSVIIYLISILVYLVMESPMKSCLTMLQKKLIRRYAPQLQ